MAGSYKHICRDDGSFRGIDLLDNLGDAHEAMEECHGLIQQLARGDCALIAAALTAVQKELRERRKATK